MDRRTVSTALLLAGLCLGEQVNAADCRLTGRPFLEGRVRGGASLSRAVDARIGEEIEVAVVLPGTLDGKPVLFGELGGRGQRSWRNAGCGPRQISWRRVEPVMQHVRTPAPNKDISVYANAVVFGPSHGRWIGYDRLEYVETALVDEDPVLIVRDAEPSVAVGVPARAPAQAKLGTMRLAATVTAGAQVRSTADARDAPAGLLSDQVFRYSLRGGDDFLGWLSAYFNVPYLFGSAGTGAKNQAERYQGADCADVLVAALRRSGRRMEYTSVSGLIGSLRVVGDAVTIRPGVAVKEPRMRMGIDVRPGDLLAINYLDSDSLPRAWDHIGALVEDRGPEGPDGVLGPEDLFADIGSAAGLKYAPLGDQGAIRVVALRPR